MVLLKTTLVGIGLLVIGMLMLTVLGQYVTVEVQEVHRHDIEPHVELFVEDKADRSYNLPGGSNVFGTVSVTQVPSNQTDDIHFLVCDSDNYQQWLSGSQVSTFYSADRKGLFNYTFTTDKSGIYYFIFDNRGLPYKKYVVLTVSYNETITNRVPDTRIVYVAWPFIIGGALILAYGLVRKPAVRWN
jgi:hypothetical protein